jgi:putative ABC transport system substrate-binding protein
VSQKKIIMRLCTFGRIVTLALAVVVALLLANAQPRGRVPRIGVLSSTSLSDREPFLDGLGHWLQELGWVEGQTLAVEWRWA